MTPTLAAPLILGLSDFSHDSSAALLGPPGVLAAIEEGKMQRSRNVAGIPREAIRFCLEEAGAQWKDISIIAVASRPLRAWTRRAMMRARQTPVAPVSTGYYQSKAIGELGRELNNLRILEQLAGDPTGRVLVLDHHLCHAASAFFASPFERALVLTLDEQGDGRSGLVATGAGTHLRPRKYIPFPNSLAWIFSQVTELLGFRPQQDEHKTQWLSLTGEPVYAPVFLELLRRGGSPYPHLNSRFFRRGFAGRLAFSKAFYDRLKIPPPPEPLAESVRANLAASVQRACAVVVSELAEALRLETRETYLCLAGGLFLNPLLVAELERNTGFERIFVQPAAGNEGTALGAAWLAWHEHSRRPRSTPIKHLFLGPRFTNEEIKQVLDNCKSAYRWCDSDERTIEETLKFLEAGKIVAWYQGPAEFGPRALGNRSLLASPWAPYVRENLNDFVKHRESFRPFALSVPEEDRERYFECGDPALFMATMGRVRPEFRELFDNHTLPGGLLRIHVVARDSNPLFWRLLKSFGDRSPAPVLVNTSFNLFGEPLVVTPRDAVRSYFCSGVDVLVAGNFLLSKS
ncbi:MAG: carbamoyltransferase family protein [Candidatus Acidiferrales bacterium]